AAPRPPPPGPPPPRGARPPRPRRSPLAGTFGDPPVDGLAPRLDQGRVGPGERAAAEAPGRRRQGGGVGRLDDGVAAGVDESLLLAGRRPPQDEHHPLGLAV